MAVFALIVGALLLVCANFGFRGSRPVGPTLTCGLVFSALPLVLGVFCYPVWELAAALVILAGIYTSSARRWPLHAWSVAAAGVVFGANSLFGWDEVSQLQRQYPYESLEGRLPERPVGTEQTLLHEDYWASMEEEITGHMRYRTDSLKDLHENAVKHFIQRPNFGFMRMSGMKERALRLSTREKSVPQPGVRSTSAENWDEVGVAVPVDGGLHGLQRDSVLDFLNPLGLGYAKDRRHVAGFDSHGFDRVPTSPWKIRTLDLVGLVVHPKPVVYMSDNLPRMEELRKAPTRDLSAFESAGLAKLREGDDLFVRQMPEGSLRALGAVRALKQCLGCHGGARGDLLGAFSYDLRPADSR